MKFKVDVLACASKKPNSLHWENYKGACRT